MTFHDWLDIGAFVLSFLLGIIGWLLVRKIDGLEARVTKLEEQHVEDVAALAQYKTKVAEDYSSTPEIRDMFKEFTNHLDEKFKLVEMLINTINITNNNTGNTTGRFRRAGDREI